jgi:hypothetical protein
MIFELTDSYVGFVTYTQQHDPLPMFAIARSRLELEEPTTIQRATHEFDPSSGAFVAKTPNSTDATINLPIIRRKRHYRCIRTRKLTRRQPPVWDERFQTK